MDGNSSTLHKILYTVRNASILKTTYYSFMHHGLIIIGKRSRVRIERGANIKIVKRGFLALGLQLDLPYGSALNVRKGGTLVIEGRVNVMRGTSIFVGPKATLSVGASTIINENSKII